jgi:hypothetical protein
MTKIIRLSQVIALICILTACESCDEHQYPGRSSDMPGTLTLSINTQFTTSFIKRTTGKSSNTDPVNSVCQLEQFGQGTDAELGGFDVYLICCWNPAVGSQGCTEGYVTDYEGNTLTLLCNDDDSGVDFTPDFPYDQTYICYKFDFTGGTGRFEGASGRGTIECEVKGDSNSIIHHWEASLTLLTE